MKNQKPLIIRDKTIFDGVFVKYFLKTVYIIWFKLAGWKTVNSAPRSAGVAIAAPHTSNWDIVYALGAAIMFDVKIYFSIKESWCRVPVIGSIIMWLGAIPIDRSAKGQVQLIKQFVDQHKNNRVFFLFTPEGTRGHVKSWKTGFYHIAQDCGIPIFLAKVDYRTKVSGVFHSFQLTGDKDADIDAIQESYKRVCGKKPQLQYPPYKGPLPDISDREIKIMRALYSIKGLATQAEISAKSKFDELTEEMLDFLVDKGVLERETHTESGRSVNSYRLTVAGNGCLLHLTPTLNL
ncbi:MAG: 1-acyl-sn-glycerol-3-phosphate acyltransferase [Pseudomonadales bacterium]|nr:1-acyl-sn-glycerol-3-phosphate acyltransferase [Pseudomonadales bacterium]